MATAKKQTIKLSEVTPANNDVTRGHSRADEITDPDDKKEIARAFARADEITDPDGKKESLRWANNLVSDIADRRKKEAENLEMYGEFAECKNKSQLAVKLWELNPDLKATEIVELASKVRPDLEGFALSDANNGKVKWRQSQGIQGRSRTQTKVPGNMPLSESSQWEAAFHFVETCGGIEPAIAMLSRLQNLKDIL